MIFPTTTAAAPQTGPRRVRPIRNPLPARVPAGAVYVGRAGWGLPASPYANAHPVDKPCPVLRCAGQIHDQAAAVAAYRVDVTPQLAARARAELAGRDLCCWCREGTACHADVLLSLAEPTRTRP